MAKNYNIIFNQTRRSDVWFFQASRLLTFEKSLQYALKFNKPGLISWQITSDH